MSKTLFVTSYYGKLWSTKFGGRSGREENYLRSFVSLVRMPADFVIYTSEEEKPIIEKFISEHIVTTNRITIIVYNLENFIHHVKINSILGGFNNLQPDRCFEIQYGKLYWLENHLNEDYETIYWVDIGLSHIGLWPQKYTFGHDWYTKQFYFNIFNGNLLNNLNDSVIKQDKIFTIALDQTINKGYGNAAAKYYTHNNSHNIGKIHVVGGLFGGTKSRVKDLITKFKEKTIQVLSDDALYTEEQILSILVTNEPERYIIELFENWYHEDSKGFEHTLTKYKKSFYQIFEKYNNVSNAK